VVFCSVPSPCCCPPWQSTSGTGRDAAFRPAGRFLSQARAAGPGRHPEMVSFTVALASLGSGEPVAEAPAGTCVSDPRQEERGPTALLGEVFWGLHRRRELCLLQKGGFALSALSLWQQELCRLGQAAASPARATRCPRPGQGVPWARCSINGKNCFYFLADLTSLKQLPV